MLNICTNQRITKVFDSQIFYDIFLHFVSNIILPNKMHILLPCPALEYRKISIFNTFTHSVKIFSYFLSRITLIIDGRRKPRPGLPSGKECCKQSDPEQLVVRRSEGNWTRALEYETPPASGTRERSSRYHGCMFNMQNIQKKQKNPAAYAAGLHSNPNQK